MTVVFEELQDLRGVWSELSRIWSQIDEIREKPWLSIQPRKLRQQLDTLTNQLKELPARLRQYSSYEYVKKLLQGYSKVNDWSHHSIFSVYFFDSSMLYAIIYIFNREYIFVIISKKEQSRNEFLFANIMVLTEL